MNEILLQALIRKLKLEKKRYNLSYEIAEWEIEKLKLGMPIQKIIGFVNYDNLIIKLKHNVLIPRYETEEVLLEALKKINKMVNPQILDMCCGSGYIGLTLKQKLPNANVFLLDNEKEAILQTKENALINNLDVKVIKSDLFKALSNQKFDLIIANPPYIPANKKLSPTMLQFEPVEAFLAKENGNYFYRKIIEKASYFLNSNGYLFFEISIDNTSFLKEKGFTIKKDINNQDRIAYKKFD